VTNQTYMVHGVPCVAQPCPLRHLHDHQRGPHTVNAREARADRARLFSLYIAHARGVADGAGRRAMSKSQHRSPEGRAAYERGYATGQKLARDACAQFGAEIGYKPSTLVVPRVVYTSESRETTTALDALVSVGEETGALAEIRALDPTKLVDVLRKAHAARRPDPLTTPWPTLDLFALLDAAWGSPKGQGDDGGA
jgi:hypothetical protein